MFRDKQTSLNNDFHYIKMAQFSFDFVYLSEQPLKILFLINDIKRY